jgi:hypothetical protein
MGPFHRYGGVVAVHALSREHHRFDMPERRFQRDPDGPDRTSQRRDAERCPLSGEAPRLAVERLVLTEFLIDDQPVGWAGESARDDVERRGILVDCLAIATNEFLPDILDHLMSARKALQRLGDRLSKLCKPRPPAARAGIWPWQIDALALRHAVYGLRSTVYGQINFLRSSCLA